MRPRSLGARLALSIACFALALPLAVALAADPLDRAPDVHWEPTMPEVVEAMLRAAGTGPNDVVYDLGCGDGRIVIAAAREFGARAVGIDIDPQRIAEANANAQKAGVADRVRFIRDDLFTADFRDATVVTLYLLPDLNLKLRPRLLAELKPGTRIVSHKHDMGDWKPDRSIRVGNRIIHVWTVPARNVVQGGARAGAQSEAK